MSLTKGGKMRLAFHPKHPFFFLFQWFCNSIPMSCICILLLTCSCDAQHQLPVCEVKVTPDLRLKPPVSERRKPANALKPTKDVYLNQLLESLSRDLSPTRGASPAGLLHSDLSSSAFVWHFQLSTTQTLSATLTGLGLTYGWVSSSVANKQKNTIDLGWGQKETCGLVCREQGSRLIKVAPRAARDVSVMTPA